MSREYVRILQERKFVYVTRNAIGRGLSASTNRDCIYVCVCVRFEILSISEFIARRWRHNLTPKFETLCLIYCLSVCQLDSQMSQITILLALEQEFCFFSFNSSLPTEILQTLLTWLIFTIYCITKTNL